MMDDLTFEVRVRFRGRDLHLTKIVTQDDIDDMRPPRGPVGPMDMSEVYRRGERRQRFIDMLAANLAQALANGMIEENERRLKYG